MCLANADNTHNTYSVRRGAGKMGKTKTTSLRFHRATIVVMHFNLKQIHLLLMQRRKSYWVRTANGCSMELRETNGNLKRRINQ